MRQRKQVLSFFRDKKVLITGHTGFKGSWLTQWLLMHQARVFGISNSIPTNPSLFEVLSLEKQIEEHIDLDINNKDEFIAQIARIKPDFIFHLAAQPIVSVSYQDPIQTLSTNVMGTAHLLEGIRYLENRCVAIIVTTDKCYENQEWVWGYRETDHLGGKDIYSSSKAAAEIVFSSYYRSFFKDLPNIRMASARAGNVIGGGDWAKDRIVPDCMVAWDQNEKVILRNPFSTRPWQHVLEPLSGYITLAHNLWHSEQLDGHSFNFGPPAENNVNVLTLLTQLGQSWGIENIEKAYLQSGESNFAEGNLLQLNCDKAHHYLHWRPVLELNKLVEYTGDWYYNYYRKEKDVVECTRRQIRAFEGKAEKKQIPWAMQ